jgi:Domain of unknown function (DUF4136)
MKLLVPMFACLGLLSAGVKITYDHQADFAQFKTYRWIASNDRWGHNLLPDVDSQLAAKGWTKVESEADAVVSVFSRTDMKETLQLNYDRYGDDWLWQRAGSSKTEVEVPVGTLVVDIFDGKTKKLIWRGTAKDLNLQKPDPDEKQMVKSIQDMFEKFPPKAH